jgi:hypothetical protein
MNAMDDWVKNGDQPGHDDGFADHEVSEEDILTGGGNDAGPAIASQFQEAGAPQDDDGAGEGDSEEAAHAAKKARDSKILMGVGGAVLVLVLGAVGFHLYGSSGSSPQQVAQVQAQQQAQQQAHQQPSGAAPAPVGNNQAPVIAPMPEASAPAPVDFGLQPGAPLPADGQPAIVNGFPAPVVPATAPAVQAVAPVGAGAPVTAQPPVVGAPGQVPVTAPAQVAPAATPGVSPAELNDLRAEVAALGQKVTDLSKEVAALRSRPQVQTSARSAAQQAPVAAKPEPNVSERREPKNKALVAAAAASAAAAAAADTKYTPIASPVLTDSKATPVALTSVTKNGKVRSEFTVYAISNGRAWVRWSGDGENYMVEKDSVLPDNSKVTNVDNVKGVVFTTAGEIHQKPSK